MKIKTRELIDAALDWAVAKCLGWEGVICKNPAWAVPLYIATNDTGLYTYAPSTDWAQGGPLKEREGIVSGPSVKGDFFAFKPVKDADSAKAFGPTELVAAMRCLVAVKLGDEVDIPDELAP